VIEFGFSARAISRPNGARRQCLRGRGEPSQGDRQSGQEAPDRRLFARLARAHFVDPGRSGGQPQFADSWQEALGLAAKGAPVAMILRSKAASPTPSSNWSRAGHPRRPACPPPQAPKDADAFLPNCPRSMRDLVVHIEHGIGKYLGLEPITVGEASTIA